MAAPTAAPEDLDDCADLGLIEWCDWHCLRRRHESQAGGGDEGGRDELLHDDLFSWVRDKGGAITLTITI